MLIKFKKLDPMAIPFTYVREGDACMDVYALNPFYIPKFGRLLVGTGIALEIPEGYEGIIRGRSGFARNGILTHVGTIDSNYRGEIGVLLFNTTSIRFSYDKPYCRIAQFCIQKVTHFNLIESREELSNTNRGDQGYGSSGY